MKKLIAIITILMALIIPCIYIDAQDNSEPVQCYKNEVTQNESNELDFYQRVENEYRNKLSELESSQDKMQWFIEYKDLIQKYSFVLDAPETIYDYYTDDEICMMQRIVETEGFQAPFAAKVNIASVILNRLNNDAFEGTPIEIMTAANQFVYGRTLISDETILALEYAFEIEDPTNGCIAFHSNNKTNTFNGWDYVFTDTVGHNYYR